MKSVLFFNRVHFESYFPWRLLIHFFGNDDVKGNLFNRSGYYMDFTIFVLCLYFKKMVACAYAKYVKNTAANIAHKIYGLIWFQSNFLKIVFPESGLEDFIRSFLERNHSWPCHCHAAHRRSHSLLN